MDSPIFPGPVLIPCCWAALLAGCSPSEPNKLASLAETTVGIKEHSFRVWIADQPDVRERGMMKVTAQQAAPLPDGTERGMIFVFPREQRSGFWMKNTIIPLDIAFIRTDGTIVTIHTMAPLDTRSYYPDGPYRYALEVRGNLFSRLGIRSGDRVEIPDSLLKTAR